jgi:hypothetical protein
MFCFVPLHECADGIKVIVLVGVHLESRHGMEDSEGLVVIDLVMKRSGHVQVDQLGVCFRHIREGQLFGFRFGFHPTHYCTMIVMAT